MPYLEQSDLFLRACRRQPVERTPVWFMRQAGRYLPEYRALRARHSLLELCRTPELAAEITLFTVKTLGVDAAIIFADLLLPAQAMGMELEFVEGEGPVLSEPIRTAEDFARLHLPADGELRCVAEAIRAVCTDLDGKLPVIGFCGAPFTLASYMIEGGASRDFLHTKRLMFHQPELWDEVVNQLVKVLSDFLRSQVAAGATALQIFDSWVGCLGPEDYRRYVLPGTRALLKNACALGVPVIHFGTGTASLLELMREAGGDVIGVDWRVELDDAWRRIGHDVAIQGNLDPTLLFGPVDQLRERVERILRQAERRPGHIFNLGHGVLPGTPVENVLSVVEMVHRHSLKSP
ncbi:MAG: uroporphyrinogen decarboxylase [Acidobacteria bacterium]|nr:uroporphyrinogen decarboxylase [Acidobacteriota bacterium]